MNKYKISGIPVVDDHLRLNRHHTNRDLRFEPDEDQMVSDIMTREHLITLRSAPAWNRPSGC